ncbi:MAG: BMC domain-containing protein [Actinomycetota bacterium]
MMADYSNICVLEFKSVSRGIQVTDSAVKAAEANLVIATSLCPGKYLTVLEGEMDALETVAQTARIEGGMHLYSEMVIGGIDLKVIDAISGKVADLPLGAVGIIESMQMAPIINAADICVDSADVEFLDFRLARGCGVNSFFLITGTLSAVKEAAGKASSFLSERGALIGERIIANPDKEVARWLKSSLCRC